MYILIRNCLEFYNRTKEVDRKKVFVVFLYLICNISILGDMGHTGRNQNKKNKEEVSIGNRT